MARARAAQRPTPAPKQKAAPVARAQAPRRSRTLPRSEAKVPATLVDVLYIDEELLPDGTGRISTDEQLVSLLIARHFPGWDERVIGMALRNKQSLRQRITTDRTRSREDDDFKMGKCYWLALHEEFGDACPEVIVRVEDEGQDDDEHLKRCVKKALDHPRDFEPLSDYLETLTSLNQKMVAFVYRALMRINPNTNIDNAGLHLEAI